MQLPNRIGLVRPYYDFLRVRIGALPEPSFMPWDLTRLYRGTVFLAGGADYVLDCIKKRRPVPHILQAAQCLREGLARAEGPLNDLNWAWAALRVDRPVVYRGEAFPTPLAGSMVAARRVLNGFPGALDPLLRHPELHGDLPLLWMLTCEVVEPEAYAFLDWHCSGLLIPSPAVLATEASQNLAHLWMSYDQAVRARRSSSIWVQRATAADDEGPMQNMLALLTRMSTPFKEFAALWEQLGPFIPGSFQPPPSAEPPSPLPPDESPRTSPPPAKKPPRSAWPLWSEGDLDGLQPLPRRLLEYMECREAARLVDLCPAVWGRDYAELSGAAIDPAISRANAFLRKQLTCTRFLSHSADLVRWE